MKLKLMADYCCWPLWYNGPDNTRIGPVDPETLPLSKALKERLLKWSETFDKQLDLMNPRDVLSAPEWTTEEALWFDNEGRELWIQLRGELGTAYQVSYFFRGKLFDDPDSLPV